MTTLADRSLKIFLLMAYFLGPITIQIERLSQVSAVFHWMCKVMTKEASGKKVRAFCFSGLRISASLRMSLLVHPVATRVRAA